MATDWSTLHHQVVFGESDGKISGITEIGFNPKTPYRLGQGTTGVQEQYRGRGLGKWLKADMLMLIRGKYP